MNFNKFNCTFFGGLQELQRDLFNLSVISGCTLGWNLLRLQCWTVRYPPQR